MSRIDHVRISSARAGEIQVEIEAVQDAYARLARIMEPLPPGPLRNILCDSLTGLENAVRHLRGARELIVYGKG